MLSVNRWEEPHLGLKAYDFEPMDMNVISIRKINAFRKVLLERLTSRIGPAFRKVKNEMYTKHADGFYVRAEPNLCTPDITIKYISRYLGRPVIATSRIDTYDGENVTFHYTRHEDNKTVTECNVILNEKII